MGRLQTRRAPSRRTPPIRLHKLGVLLAGLEQTQVLLVPLVPQAGVCLEVSYDHFHFVLIQLFLTAFSDKPAGNLFGGGSNKPPATSNLFGAPAQANTDASSSAIPSTAAPSLPSGGLNIFGAKPVEQSSGAPLTSLFAKPATPQPPAGGCE